MMSLTAVIEHSALTIAAAELAAGLVVGAIVTSGELKAIPALSSRPAIALGRMSYGIYLWHYPAAFFLRGEYGAIASTLGTLTFALVGAGISFHTVEAWGSMMRKGLVRPHAIRSLRPRCPQHQSAEGALSDCARQSS
jgi:peptidoglycan/LPS O-acetylase OafA/YrhL